MFLLHMQIRRYFNNRLYIDHLELLKYSFMFVQICFVFRMYVLQTFVTRDRKLSVSKLKTDIDSSRLLGLLAHFYDNTIQL